MLADLANRAVPAHELVPCAPSPAVLAMMSAADRDLERRIAEVRLRLARSRTSFGRRMALAQLELLEGRRSPAALRALCASLLPKAAP